MRRTTNTPVLLSQENLHELTSRELQAIDALVMLGKFGSNKHHNDKEKRQRDSDEDNNSALSNAGQGVLSDSKPEGKKRRKRNKKSFCQIPKKRKNKNKNKSKNFCDNFKRDADNILKKGTKIERLSAIRKQINAYESANPADQELCQIPYVRLLLAKGKCIANSDQFDNAYKQIEVQKIITRVDQFGAVSLELFRQTDNLNELKASLHSLSASSHDNHNANTGMRFFQPPQPSNGGNDRYNADYQPAIPKK